MKKRIRDITLEEYIKTCVKYKYCASCPFRGHYVCLNRAFAVEEEQLNKEIEL